MPKEWTGFDAHYCSVLQTEAERVDLRVLAARAEGREEFAQSLEHWAATLRSWVVRRERLKPPIL